jgi:6-phosphogluconolactonase
MNNLETGNAMLRKFATADEMIRDLADEIVASLDAGVDAHSAASFVASGGTTPGPLFDALTERDAPWDRVFVTLSDERWVPPTEDASNEKLIRSRLLRGKASAAHFVPMKTGHAHPCDAEVDVSAAISAMPRPFDVTLLGMGDDGHTASMFPGSDGLDAAFDTHSPLLVRGIHPAKLDSTGERMSLTLRAILDSRLVIILIRGDAKLETYRAALAGDDVHEMPVRAVLKQSVTPVQVYWAP